MAKLVTILARELKDWPVRNDYPLTQAYDGHLFVRCADREYGKETIRTSIFVSISDDITSATITRAQWEAERARILLENQPEHDAEIKELVEIACAKKQPRTFTESDIKAAFEAGANWANGGVKAGADEYVEKLKGLK